MLRRRLFPTEKLFLPGVIFALHYRIASSETTHIYTHRKEQIIASLEQKEEKILCEGRERKKNIKDV